MLETFGLGFSIFLICCPILSMIFLSLAIFFRWESIDRKTGFNGFFIQPFRFRGDKVVNDYINDKRR